MSVSLEPSINVGHFRLPRPLAFVGVSIALALFFVVAGVPTPLLPMYEAKWHFATWLLALAFGIYSVGMLVALLTIGSLSDYVGRRPILIGALALELVTTVMFLVAPSVGWIITARGLQGIATGAATSAFSAAMIDLADDYRKPLAAVITGTAPVGGLAIGIILSGGVAQINTHAAAIIWAGLTVVLVIGVVFAWCVPEAVASKPGAVASLIPRVSVPKAARRQFVVAVFSLTGAWMTAALFIGLMPAILAAVFHAHGALESGATSFIEPAIAAVATLLAGRARPERLAVPAGIGVVVGALLVVMGIATATLPVLWLGGAVSGFGFGATLSATIRSLAPQAQPHERAGLFAAIYVVAYTAFGVPAIVAGALMAAFGIADIALAFGIVIVVFAGIGVIRSIQFRRR